MAGAMQTMAFGVDSGKIKRRTRVMFPGTKAEEKVTVGQHLVKPEGAHFVASEITPYGPDDAAEKRALRDGREPPIPFRVRAARAADRIAEKRKKQAEARKLGGADDETKVVVVQQAAAPAGPEAELAAQLAAFADEPEMQTKILVKWQKKHAEAKKAAAVAVAAGTADTDR